MRLYAKNTNRQNPRKRVQGPAHLLPDPRLERSPLLDGQVMMGRPGQHRPGWRDPVTFRGAVMAAIVGGLVVAVVLSVAPHLWPYLHSML